METPLKNLLEQYSFEIQEIKETTKKIDLSIKKDRNKDVIKDVKHIPYYDSTLNSTPIGHVQEIFNENTKRILLKQELVRNHHDIDHSNRRVVKLNNSDSKMALQYEEMANCGNSNVQNNIKNYESMEILQKLPPDTIVIRQEGKASRENSDYKELTETNSSSISTCAIAKLKIPRAFRNKTHETIEMRRNPMRVSKKNADEDFPRPKQRLLTSSKRETCLNYKFSKHMKSSTMPYMNTRSVTRKMYTVGATYQPPTKRDETEWKEWPVHGMHERPFYHLQAGLAVEYLGKYFTSLDGLSYCEIIDEPDIEVVAVDPYHDQRVSLAKKRLRGKMKVKSKYPLNVKDVLNSYFSVKNKSFEMCMHRSLHCVLGYCSQVMTSAYKQAVQDKIMKLTVPVAKTRSLELTKPTNIKDNATSSLENKYAEKAKLLEAYTIAMKQSVQNKSTTNNTDDRRVNTTFPSSSAIYTPKALRSTEIDRSKITPQSRDIMNLKRFLRSTPNSSLILLRSSAAKMSGEVCTITAKNVFNQTKLENMSINDETFMKISSVYKKLMFIDKPTLSPEELPARNNVYTLKRHATNAQGYATKKISLDTQLENKKIEVSKKILENKNVNEMKISKKLDSEMFKANSGKGCTWYMNETSEIAKILSEYNRNTLRKSGIQNQIYGSRSMTVNSTIKSLTKNLWKGNTTAKNNQNLITDKNSGFDFSQGRQRQLHLTLEKIKGSQVVDSNQNTWSSSTSFENCQIPLRNQQISTSNVKEKLTESCKDSNKSKIVMVDARLKETNSKNETEISKTKSLQNLLEDTAILYCAASGVHQDDLSNYIDNLDSKQSIQWLKSWDNFIM